MLSRQQPCGLGGKGNLRTNAFDRALARVRRPLDRAYERHALALDDLAALSDDVYANVREDPEHRRGAGPRVLVASLRGWSSHNAHELAIAHALRLRGAQVALLTCGGGMPACELGWARGSHPRPCDRCAWLTDRVVDAAGLQHYALRDLLPWGADARRAPAEPTDEGDVNPHEASAISVASLLKATQLDRVARSGEIVNDFAVAAGGVERAAVAVLDQFQPEIVLLLNGLFGAERVIRELALARGIHSPTYEFGVRTGTMIFSQDTFAPAFDVDRLWAKVRDRPLEQRQRAEVIGLLHDRAHGIGHEPYHDKPEDDHEEIRRRLDIQGRERIVSLFTNVTWDSATVGHDIGFDSMFDWIERTVRTAAGLDLTLVMRVHPAEARWGTREGVQDVIVSRLGVIPQNVRFVSAEHALSSYALLDISDLTLTYTTTVGLEAAARGKHVAVAGETHYRGRGFTTDLAGPDDLARVLADERAAPSTEQVELAIRYAHMFFLRVMIPFPLIESSNGRVTRFPRSAAALAPGADAYLDWICARILDGGHFGLPDELAVASLARSNGNARGRRRTEAGTADEPKAGEDAPRTERQEDLFRKDEADAWFRRNVVKLADEKRPVRDVMTGIALEIAEPNPRIVDVGASNGWRVAAIAQAVGGAAVAVDPSREALEDGRTRYPWVTFLDGVAREIPLDSEYADLVIVSGVLTWVDRAWLMAAVSEIDRILRDGGHLLLGDFLPDAPTRVRYHHRPDRNAWTYKQDYAHTFLAGGLYTEVRRVIIDPQTGEAATSPVSPHERQSVSLLHKDLQGQYREG